MPMSAPGQLLPVTLSTDRTPEGLFHIETCRKTDSGSSAKSDLGTLVKLGRQCIRHLPLGTKS